MATVRSNRVSRALYTSPPAPIFERISYRRVGVAEFVERRVRDFGGIGDLFYAPQEVRHAQVATSPARAAALRGASPGQEPGTQHIQQLKTPASAQAFAD